MIPVPRRTICAITLGRREYGACLGAQRELQGARIRGEIPNLLLLTEHEAVYTLGRSHPEPSLRVPGAEFRALGIPVVQTERGGDITYHGPGQLVAYGILHLKQMGLGPVDYVAALERAAIRWLAEFGIAANTRTGARGAWVGERKIASIGIQVRSWVTMHGIAINLEPELAHFAAINPCGLDGVEMTSIRAETGAAPEWHGAASGFARVLLKELASDGDNATGELEARLAAAGLPLDTPEA